MKLRELNEYRKAGIKLRRSPRMRKIRERFELITEQMEEEENPEEWMFLLNYRYIHQMSIVKVCMKMHISERTYFRILKKAKSYMESH